MVKQELPIAPEISEFLAVGMGFEPIGFSLGQAHGLSCFAHDTDMIKMDRMITLVLFRNNHHSISGNFFIHGDINAQEKANDQKADQNDYSNFTLLRFSHRSVLLQGPRFNQGNVQYSSRKVKFSCSYPPPSSEGEA